METRGHKKGEDQDAWHLTFAQSCWAALGLDALIFFRPWSGYSPREPDLFFPRPLREIWWVLPVAVAGNLVCLQMARLLDVVKDRPWPYGIAYMVALIGVVFLAVWLVVFALA